jgi:multiple sugar transport system substrate-binding protein
MIRTMKFKSLFVAASVSLLMGSTIGCSTNEGSSASTKPSASVAPAASTGTTATTAPKEDPKIELTVWAAPNGTYKPGQKAGDWFKEDLLPEWNKLHPNVKVNIELIPFDGINEKVTTAIASKSAPNVFLDYPGRTLAYGQMGALASLESIIPPADLAQVKKSADMMKMVSVGGTVVTLPYYSTQLGLILNKSLWKEAGAEKLLPQDEFRTWTPDQFKAALKAVANKDKGVYGLTLFALNEQGDQIYNNIISGYGSKLFNADYTKYTAGESPETEKALAFFKSLVDEGLVTPHPETLTSTNALDYWKQRKNGMAVASAAHSDIIKNGLKDGSVSGPNEYMYVNFPSTTPGQAALKSEIGFGVVFKNSDAVKEEWAKKFLYWSVKDNVIFQTAMKSFDPLGKAPAWTETDPELQFLAKLATKTKEWPVIDPGWGIKGYPEMRAAMFPEIQKLFIGMSTPKQTIDTISKKFNETIAKYNK